MSLQPSSKKQKTADLKEMLDGLKQQELITDNFVAAFLQAGIPVNKLDHPSIRGLVQKYTQVCPLGVKQMPQHVCCLGSWISLQRKCPVPSCRTSRKDPPCSNSQKGGWKTVYVCSAIFPHISSFTGFGLPQTNGQTVLAMQSSTFC